MIRIAELTADEKWALTRQIKYSQIILVRQKSQAIILASSGVSSEVIALGIGRSTRTITGWLKDWNKEKFTSFFSGHKYNSNASKLSKLQKDEVREALKKPPSEYGIPKEFWDVPTLKKYVKAKFDVVYESKSSYHLLLKYSNLSFKYPDTFDRRRNEQQIVERIRQIREEIQPILSDESYELFCADEVRLEQEAEIRRAWLKKGERTVISVNRTKNSQSYLGFLGQKGVLSGRCFLYKLAWGNSEQIISATRKLLRFFPDKKIAIIWDNAPCHRSKEIKEALKKGGILERVHLIPLPPYAPDTNPIEYIWNQAKKHRANIQDDTFEETKTRFESFVRNKTFKYSLHNVNKQYL